MSFIQVKHGKAGVKDTHRAAFGDMVKQHWFIKILQSMSQTTCSLVWVHAKCYASRNVNLH